MNSTPLERLKKSPIARKVSYAIGGLALAFLITAGFLLGFDRDHKQVITVITPTASISVSKVPEPTVTLAQVTKGTPNPYGTSEFSTIVSPIVSVGENVPTSVTVTPVYPPGDIPFADTISMPLQRPAEGMGWCAMLPDASGFFTSFENGYAIVGQFTYNGESKNFEAASSSFQQGQNRIQLNCPSGDNPPAPSVNEDASAVGSLGYAGIATSFNNLRLYCSYRQPLMGAAANAQSFPFLQTVGAVAVFTRPSNASGPPTSTVWSYDCDLELVNPFGSQVGGFDNICDPTTSLILDSDDYGQYIRPSVNLTNGRPMVAVRMNYGYLKLNGACIAIYEETEDGTHVVSGVLQLWDLYAGTNQTFTLAEKISFGQSFDIGDDALLASIRVPANACGETNDAVNRVAYFKRNATSKIWEFMNFIETPDAKEDFGTTIAMCPDGAYAIIGSPTRATGSGSTGTAGVGGSVYMYARSSDGKTWSLNQRLQDPNPTKNTVGAFGYYVTVDKQFLICAISSNQNNVLDLEPQQPAAVPDETSIPKITLVAIDQTDGTLDASKNQLIEQPYPDASYYIDPSFGANVAMAFQDQQIGTLMIMANSPVNQLVQWYEMNVNA